jgi:hypothetical protein
MAYAPFDPTVVGVRIRHRGLTYQGQQLGNREPSLLYHLVKRVVIEGQWATGTTAADYLSDLRRAVAWPTARLAVYSRAREHLAVTACATADIVPPERCGSDMLPLLLVVYSADVSVIVTGYQFSNWEAVNIPEGALWLR